MWLKICGITTTDAIDAALAARVDAIGFIFSPSVRRLEPAQAAQLAAHARGRVSLIAVTMHPAQALIDEIIRVVKPDLLQTDLRDFDGLRLPESLARLPVLRAGIASAAALPERMLFEGARSGSGETADWDTAARLALSSELILAGGLDAHNVGQAIRAVRPYGVDVSSGVESSPGRKSPKKIAEFVQAARAAFKEKADDAN
ncbi:MAG TPA: phosphoribosylanthranilate isomerase [Steroidobacteraceae bacterium]|jgi:phosphoribosylanthranilate isomerase